MTGTSCCPIASAINRFDSIANLFVNRRDRDAVSRAGMSETLRVNGVGRVTDDSELLAASAVQDRAPKIGILIEVREAFIHCAKSLNRAGLWTLPAISTAANFRATATSWSITLPDSPRKRATSRRAEMARRGMY
jgi:predicted pyridoxine 5'-phosphate oxidase superfamily flavin-nucleotide-binding protein